MFSAATKSARGTGTAANYIEDVFSTYLYTGNGGSQTITNGIDLSGKGGMLWIKSRTSADASLGHVLADTARGRGSYLRAQSTGAVYTSGPGYDISSFNNNGFSLNDPNGPNNFFLTNASNNYCSWTFREQAKFFDVVTYTGDGTNNRAIPHNLGSTPGMVVVKRTNDTGAWWVWHRSLGSDDYIQLNSTAAAVSGFTNIWGPMTSTTFGVDNNASACNINTATYVAYLFAHDAGGFGTSGTDNVISCGSFTQATGLSTINLGYEPQFVLVKAVSSTGSWWVADNMRGMSNSATSLLRPNLSNAEYNDGATYIIPNATGFSVSDGLSGAGITLIYMAIRRPMKVPTTGTSVFSPIASSAGTGTKLTTGFPVDLQMVALRGGNPTNSMFMDRLRGISTNATESSGRYLVSSATDAENTANPNRSLFWDNTGFQMPSGLQFADGVWWNFRRASGFFDVVCSTGGSSLDNQRITHNLTVPPELIILKARAAERNWQVYHSSLGVNKYLWLNSTNAQGTVTNGYWGTANPTATDFGINVDNVGISNQTFVAYLFASCLGVSKVGTYTGTGATQTINCGFTGGARFVMIKNVNNVGNWFVWDTARGMVSGTNPSLALNSTAAEVNANSVYTVSTGFQIVSTASAINANGGAYIFLAIA